MKQPRAGVPRPAGPSGSDYEARAIRQPGALSRRSLVRGAVAALLASVVPLDDRLVAARGAEAEKVIAHLVHHLPLAEKVAQLFVFEAAGTFMSSTPWFEGLLRDVKPGGIIFTAPNVGTPREVKTLIQAIHATNPVVPPLIAVDQEGGPVTRIPGDRVPGAVDLGREPGTTVRHQAKERATFLASFGFDVNFAPVADVAYDANSAMAARSFGSDPTTVAHKVSDFVHGSHWGRMAGAAKHFPGHGRTRLDSHRAIPEVDISHREWRRTDALPFRAAIRAGVEMVMIGHLRYRRWDDAPASLSPIAVTALRKDLRFDGVVVTDDLGMGALAELPPFDVLDRAIAAGVDLLLYASPPVPMGDLVTHLLSRVQDGTVAQERIDASLRRILGLKVRRFGLTR